MTMVLNLHQVNNFNNNRRIQVREILFSPIKILNVTYLHTFMFVIIHDYQAHGESY